MTDSVTFVIGFTPEGVRDAGRDNYPEGRVSSWTVDHAGGYTDEKLVELTWIVRTLGLAIKSGRNQRMARTLLEVYLGKDVRRRVLSGEIKRGLVRSMSAVQWYCDLQGSIKVADITPPYELIKLLNDYFENMVEPIHAAGGQVLKLMTGDKRRSVQ